MALTIRLRRMGTKNRKQWGVVVIESAKARDGRMLEEIGHYNPRTNPPQITIQKERYDNWIKKGATPSDTVRFLVKNV